MTDLAHYVRTIASEQPSASLLVVGERTVSWQMASVQAQAVADVLAGAGHALGVVGGPEVLLTGLLAASASQSRALLLPEVPNAERAEELGLSALLTEEGLTELSLPPGHDPGVVVFTSGTTSVPKAAVHDWSSLMARVRVRPELTGIPWLLPYSVRAYAGLQVVLHALANAGSVVVSTGSPGEAAIVAANHGITHLTGTPTFFRFLLATAPADALQALTPVQITLGGEAVDQALLDRLAARFPQARVGHIYASTELGACFSVHDGRAGFPAQWLDDPTRTVGLTCRDGELFVRSSRGMRGYLNSQDGGADLEWFATGDRLSIVDGRALFLGRASERINVGGAKVYPGEVEDVIRQVPGVVAVRVSGIRSSLAGQLVQAEMVAEPGADVKALRRTVLAHTREHLQPHMVPRRLVWVETLEQNASGKIDRRTS